MLKDKSNQMESSVQKAFWQWFQQNEEKIRAFDKDRERVTQMVADAIHVVDHGLTFEIGKLDENGKREFILSAGGISRNIPKVESLFLTAPEMHHWRIVKFQQRRPIPKHIELGGKTILTDDIRFQVFNDGDRIGILLMFDIYCESEREQFIKMGFLLLDRILGEYDVMTKVGFIDYAGKESNFFNEARHLPELASVFDSYFKALL